MTRFLIGDARGHKRASIGEASAAMSALCECAHRYGTLPELVTSVGVLGRPWA
jgi:hypothetical protein